MLTHNVWGRLGQQWYILQATAVHPTWGPVLLRNISWLEITVVWDVTLFSFGRQVPTFWGNCAASYLHCFLKLLKFCDSIVCETSVSFFQLSSQFIIKNRNHPTIYHLEAVDTASWNKLINCRAVMWTHEDVTNLLPNWMKFITLQHHKIGKYKNHTNSRVYNLWWYSHQSTIKSKIKWSGLPTHFLWRFYINF
jgi:hypothetical protein